MTYGLLNRLTTKPGKRDEVVQHLVESGRVFDANDACLLYLVTSPADDPTTIWVVDLWTSADAHTEALRDPSLQPHIEATVPLLEGMPEQTPLDVRGERSLGARAASGAVAGRSGVTTLQLGSGTSSYRASPSRLQCRTAAQSHLASPAGAIENRLMVRRPLSWSP